MYFSLTPDIQYDKKPISLPFSQSEYVIAKNFFRRFKIDEDKFSYSVFFKRYAIIEGDRLDSISEKTYGTPFFDWVIAITNNIINPYFDMPVAEYEIRDMIDDPDEIHHYETIEYRNQDGVVVLESGIKVDQSFVNSNYQFLNSTGGGIYTYSEVSGSIITTPITNLMYAIKENEKRREIYLLKTKYLQEFVNTFKQQSFYSKSTNYIDNQLKKAGV